MVAMQWCYNERAAQLDTALRPLASSSFALAISTSICPIFCFITWITLIRLLSFVSIVSCRRFRFA